MKNKLFAVIAICSLFVVSGSAWGLTVDSGTIDVGGKDLKIAESTQLNGVDAEIDWVKSILGDNVNFVIKHDGLTASDWKLTNESGTWAFALSDNPDYFLVKTGNNGSNNYRDYLFSNSDNASWAVLDLDDIYVTNIINIGKVSHLSDFNETQVPEPSILLLLGTSLVGLGVTCWRKAT